RCDELGRHLACRTERRIVEHCEILLDGATRRFRRQTRSTFDAVAVAGVGLDQTGVDGKAFATDQALGNAALQYALEQTPQQFTLTKPAVGGSSRRLSDQVLCRRAPTGKTSGRRGSDGVERPTNHDRSHQAESTA